MSTVAGLKLVQTLGQVLGIDKSKWVFWSDSMDIFYWIRGQTRKFKPFVANRVGEIRASTNPEQWRYVPTKLNSSDLLTRGLSVSTLADPAFLKRDPSEWPETKIETKRVLDVEIRKLHQIKEHTVERAFLSSGSEDRLEPKRYSSWSKPTRVSARVDRFIENCRLPVALRREGSLLTDEVFSAGMRFIRQALEEVFKEEIRTVRAERELPSASKLQLLRPVLDEDGILRCHGRLCYAECLPWETRYPIILPHSHWVTTLIIKQAHKQTQHAGTNQVLAQLSVQYWIISAKEAIKEWERECMQC